MFRKLLVRRIFELGVTRLVAPQVYLIELGIDIIRGDLRALHLGVWLRLWLVFALVWVFKGVRLFLLVFCTALVTHYKVDK